MRKYIFASFIIIFSMPYSFGQFAFTAKPGLSTNGATFGYKFHKTFFGTPIISAGIDYLHVSATYETDGSVLQELYSNNGSPNYSYILIPYQKLTDAAINIYAPNINVKLLFPCVNKINAYVTASISKPYITGNASNNGEDMKLQDYLDNLNVWGYQFGFGSEYYFSDNFSVGGEFGIRIFTAKYTQEQRVQQWGAVSTPSGGIQYKQVNTNVKYILSLGYSLTYTAVSLNFYF